MMFHKLFTSAVYKWDWVWIKSTKCPRDNQTTLNKKKICLQRKLYCYCSTVALLYFKPKNKMKKISKLFTLPRLVLKSWIHLYKISITNLHQFLSSACSCSETVLLHAPIHGLKRGPTALPSVLENAGLSRPQNSARKFPKTCFSATWAAISGWQAQWICIISLPRSELWPALLQSQQMFKSVQSYATSVYGGKG